MYRVAPSQNEWKSPTGETAKRKSRLALTASVALIAVLAASTTASGESLWLGGSSSDWNTGSNWDVGSPPDSSTTVVINTDPNSGQLTPTVSASGAVTDALTLGTTSVGGSMAVTGAGTLSISGPAVLGAGGNGNGSISVNSGGTVTSGDDVILGGAVGSAGNINILGAGSAWESLGDVIVGREGAGTLRVAGGGGFSSTSTVTVSENGSILIGTASGTAGPDAVGSTLSVGAIDLDGLLQINQLGTAVDLDGPLSGAGEIFLVRGDLVLSGDTSDFSGTINLVSKAGTANNSDEAAILDIQTGLGSDVTVNVGTRNNGTEGRGSIHLSGDGDYNVAAALNGQVTSFVKSGQGTATLSGANSMSVMDPLGADFGAIEIQDGTLQITNDGNLGNIGNAVAVNGGTFEFAGSTQASNRNINLGGGAMGVTQAGTIFGLSGNLTGSGGLIKTGDGILQISTLASSTYDGDTRVEGGELWGSAATIRGDINALAGTTVVFNEDTDAAFSGQTDGDGDYIKRGAGDLTLAAASDTNWQIDTGTLSAETGEFTGDVDIATGAAFNLGGTGGATWDGLIEGDGTFNKNGTSALILTADNSGFGGTTNVGGGSLAVNGDLGGDVNVASGGSLGGVATIGGDVAVNGGTLQGAQGQTLTINGDTVLDGESVTQVALGAPEAGYNDALFEVGGDLTIGGEIEVSNAGGAQGDFRAGVYRIFDYGGELTNTGLTVGAVPTGTDIDDVSVITAMAGHVDLVNSGGLDISYWDGGPDANKNNRAIDGGSGIWRNGDANWANGDEAGYTAGDANGQWNSELAIFGGAAGTVTIDDSEGGPVSAVGLQFVTSGYTITGDPLTLVGDGDAIASIGVDQGVATIEASLQGTALIDKWGQGTLVVSGDSSGYGGDTTVSEGTLQVDGQLGGSIEVDNGASLTGQGIISEDVTINAGGHLVGAQGRQLTMGDLSLDVGATVDVSLGTPGNTQGLFVVNGDLLLDGTLNVTDAGGFGRGVYRIIDYTGELDDQGLDPDNFPGGYQLSVQTAIDKEVNLVVGSDVQFWNGTTTSPDGTIDGGDGTWIADPRTNWTDENGNSSQSWQQDIYAVFQGAAGTVTVDNDSGQVSVGGMQFAVDGYSVDGGTIELGGTDDGQTEIRVGDGTAAGADYVATIGSELIGTSGLEKTDLGTLVLTADNSYSGGTTVSGGTLVLGSGGTTGSIQGDAVVDGSMLFNRSDEYAFNGIISGEGLVGQIGSGTTVLTADSSSFGGDTVVANGGLRVTGSLGGLIEVRDGALLDGTGTVGDVAVQKGGTIGAGTSGSISDFHTGDLTFAAGSNYLVNVAADGTGDHIFSSGETVINGGLVDVRAGSGNYADQTRYTIITAQDGVIRAGANDGFDDVTSDLAFLTPTLEYDANNVYLVMERNDFSFCLPGSTRNQCATGNGVESTGPGNPIFDTVLNLTDPEARDAFDQLSGEIHASAQTALIEDSRFVREATGDRVRSAFGSVGAPQKVLSYEPGTDVKDPTSHPVWVDATQAEGLALWGHGFGSWGQFDGDGNAADMTRDIGGLFVGGDVPVFDNMRFGVVGGYSHSSFSVANRNSSGSSENYDVGVYGGGRWNNLGLRFGANYTWHNLSTDRAVAYRGFSDSLSADYDAHTIQAYGEAGYGIDLGSARFEPFAGLAYVNLKTDGFTENGGAAALTGFGEKSETTFATLGIRATHTFALSGYAVTASGMVGWRHAFGDTDPTTKQQFAGGNPFTVSGVPLAEDVAVFEAGLNTAINDQLSIGVSYSGQLGDGVSDHGLRGNLSWRF